MNSLDGNPRPIIIDAPFSCYHSYCSFGACSDMWETMFRSEWLFAFFKKTGEYNLTEVIGGLVTFNFT